MPYGFMAYLLKNRRYYQQAGWTNKKVNEELQSGLRLLKGIDKPVITFFGSHKEKVGSKWYRHCKGVSQELGKRGYAICSGGGPGIMHAANAGAMEVGAPSIGMKAKLLRHEHVSDNIFTHKLSFHFMFVRRFCLSIKSQALIFYPGGYGTLNELFEYVVLMQIGMVDRVPIICVNSQFWGGLISWLRTHPLKRDFLISKKVDLHLISVVDTEKEILDMILG